jgi:hypothetical protein
MEIESQNRKIREHLEKGKSITALDALYMFGCLRLSGRIYDLRREGMNITAERVEVTSPSVYNGKKHITRYSVKK